MNNNSIKLDIGCGKNKKEGYVGVDKIKYDNVDIVLDVGNERWVWEDNIVDSVYCSHVVEHLDSSERIFFVNELYRVLKKGCEATIIVPHWCSCRAYGDLTHKWPPVSEFWFYYLSREWREVNAPHNSMYDCDFNVVWGYSLSPEIISRNNEFQFFAMKFYKESISDIVATFRKK